MRYNFDIVDTERDMTITLKNISLEYLNQIANEDTIKELCNEKFYMHGMYDKVEFCGEMFMVLKSSKRFVILLNMIN